MLLRGLYEAAAAVAQLDASVRRILRLKQWLVAQPDVGIEAVGAHGSLVRAVAEASVTLLDARASALPIAAGTSMVVVEFALQSQHAARTSRFRPG